MKNFYLSGLRILKSQIPNFNTCFIQKFLISFVFPIHGAKMKFIIPTYLIEVTVPNTGGIFSC